MPPSADPSQGDPSIVKSAKRVADILALLSENPHGMSLTEIATALSVPRSSTHGLLRQMCQSRLLEQVGDTQPSYRIGILAFEVGSAFLLQRDLTEEARRVSFDVSARLNETVHIAILDGTDIVYVAKAESDQAMRVVSAVGRRLPAHATAVGRVLLSDLGDTELLQRYTEEELPALTPKTIPTRAALVSELRIVREQGFAFDDEESTPGLQCLAVPVRDARGTHVAGLSVSIPTVRMLNHDRAALLAILRSASDEMSLRLGWAGQASPQGT